MSSKQPVKPRSATAHQKLIGHAGIMGVMTLVSRVLGMFRDIVSAQLFGTGLVWDAFIYAFTIPNFLRRVVGEGALSGVFIPLYAEAMHKKNRSEADRFANNILTLLTVALGALSLLVWGILGALKAAQVLGPKGQLTAELLTILFPYIIFIALYAIAMAILNTHHHFLMPSLAPSALNLFWIAGVLWICPLFGGELEHMAHTLAWCLLFAGAAQYFMQFITFRRIGFKPTWVLDVRAPEVRKIFKLMTPAAFGFAIVQINMLIDLTLAFFVGDGANSSLWYGNRLMQLPLGVIAVAMGSALLPKFSERVAAQDVPSAARMLSFSLRIVTLLILPASAGLIALRVPIMQVLFERGAFDAASTARCARTLAAYSVGLFAFSGLKLVVPAYYAFQDTRTPVKVGTASVVLNLALNLMLMRPLGEAGLALATSVSGLFNFLTLLILIRKHQKNFSYKDIVITLLKSLLASALMGIFAFFFFNWTGGAAGGFLLAAFRLALAIIFGSLVYCVVCLGLRTSEASRVWSWIIGKDTLRHDAGAKS